MPEFVEVAEKAARAAGAVLRNWSGKLGVREKGPADLVTEADLAAQVAAREVILQSFPRHDFIGEEQPSPIDVEREYCWIVDPLDGTTNFVHGVPQYAVSVALARRGEPIAATIFDPSQNECFTAASGSGAWLNGVRLHVSQVDDLSQALVACSFPARITANAPEISQFISVVLIAQAIRRTGSAALNLAYIASGRFDAFWATETKSWDVAAGVLLVTEAGGTVRGVDGGAFDLRRPHPLATSNLRLNDQLLSLFASGQAG
jgi:myo-inositol-1(or 4)-monophosphatase